MDHLTPENTAYAAYIVTTILDKLYQGVGTELGKQSVTTVAKFSHRINELGQLLYSKYSTNRHINREVIEAGMNGSLSAHQEILSSIAEIVSSNLSIQGSLDKLAKDISLEIASQPKFVANISRDRNIINQAEIINQNYG
jgi:hypothetical protein